MPCRAAATMAYDLRLLVERVEASLCAAPRKPLCDMARELGIDRHTLERAVRNRTGTTFRHLQQEAVLVRALKLLNSEPPRSVKEVCFLLGYRSPSAFSRALRRACGQPPTRIRNASVLLPQMSADGNLLAPVGNPRVPFAPLASKTCQKCQKMLQSAHSLSLTRNAGPM